MRTNSIRPPDDLEYKIAPMMLAPRLGAPTPDTGSVARRGIVELVTAVTSVEDDVHNQPFEDCEEGDEDPASGYEVERPE